ncbi:hypothetical protein B1790_01980 [Mycobacterium sp. AT1]|nr:hypothetical protein B1790_01980 [Mycobacterium sp. AT1]
MGAKIVDQQERMGAARAPRAKFLEPQQQAEVVATREHFNSWWYGTPPDAQKALLGSKKTAWMAPGELRDEVERLGQFAHLADGRHDDGRPFKLPTIVQAYLAMRLSVD